jgi:hypothetical protein
MFHNRLEDFRSPQHRVEARSAAKLMRAIRPCAISKDNPLKVSFFESKLITEVEQSLLIAFP